jgi:hypothetical protein
MKPFQRLANGGNIDPRLAEALVVERTDAGALGRICAKRPPLIKVAFRQLRATEWPTVAPQAGSLVVNERSREKFRIHAANAKAVARK